MSDALARQELEAVLARFDVEPRNTVYVRAVRAILDGEPLEWCVKHRSVKFLGLDRCHLKGRACRFESYVRVLVAP